MPKAYDYGVSSELPSDALMSVNGVACPVCKHRYYPEDKSTYRVCSKCHQQMCTICAARDMWTCPLCRNPYATLEQLE